MSSSNNNAAAHHTLQYTIRSPWEWVMDRLVAQAAPEAAPVERKAATKDLASYSQLKAVASPRKKKKPAPAATLRLELISSEGKLIEAHHGTSSALDGLEDKDELVRTFQRCRAEHLALTPRSILMKWDCTLSELQNLIKKLPTLSEDHSVAVLKEPMGSRGQGIFFVTSVEEIYDILYKNRQRAIQEGDDFLDSVMQQKGRIPAWVLQAEVHPPLLLKGDRKFHIRTYLVAMEEEDGDEMNVLLYIFKRHEVRVASIPIVSTEGEESLRDRRAHITNGMNGHSERFLLGDIPELVAHQDALEEFCAKVVDSVAADMIRRVYSTFGDGTPEIHKHAVAGLDIMVTTDYRFYLLEANVNPAAASQEGISPEFEEHLVGFLRDYQDLVLNRDVRNFRSVNDILNKVP